MNDRRQCFRNTAKMIGHSRESWQTAEHNRLIHLYVHNLVDGSLECPRDGTQFINMSSYSYLGLNRHPEVIQGAIKALQEESITGFGITPTRMQPALAYRAEHELSELFGAKCLLSLSCTVATAALLPLVSSGHLIDGKPRVTVFDKRCHFCMDMIKPICADEAEVLVSPHNDLNFLEDVCKRSPRVAYIADGAYSMGGTAPIADLLMLQERYGLFLWFDDSHAISVMGDRGQGYARSQIPELNPLTIITASLEKGFGCSGGLIMTHRGQDTDFINTFGGPMCWSQNQSIANLGSILGCLKVHRSPELKVLQDRLQRNLQVFDEQIASELHGSLLPVRPIVLGNGDLAIRLSRELLDQGFYSAPVYFPITSRGREGLRVMIRADMPSRTIMSFCNLLKERVQLSAKMAEGILPQNHS